MRGILTWLVALFVVAVALAMVIAGAGVPAAAAILLAADITLALVHALWRHIGDAASSPRDWRHVDEDTYETDVDGVRCRATFQAGRRSRWVIEAFAPEKSAAERTALERRAASDWRRQPMAMRTAAGSIGSLGWTLLRRVRSVIVGATVVVMAALVLLFMGPLRSGALLLLLPAPSAARSVPETFTPLHRGHVDLATGLYIREDDDLVLDGSPPIALRRKYLSGYRVSRQFGVGATHDGESYLIGDGRKFQWAALILADGERVQFERTQAGTSLWNAMYEHRSTPSEFRGARLGWVGFGWAMRLDDGRLDLFRGCGPATRDVCARTRSRDAEGHTEYFTRDAGGRLLRLEGSGRWIAFDYDRNDRIVRARDSRQRSVRYGYDDAGRLTSAEASDGTIRLYTYTDRDEMQSIREPERSVVNTYDAGGRVVRQVTWPACQAQYVFTFTYRVERGTVVGVEVSESDGTWRRLTFRNRYSISESYRRGDVPLTTFDYERDPITNVIEAVTVTCLDRHGRPVTHSSPVTTGDINWIKQDLVQTGCAFSSWQVPR